MAKNIFDVHIPIPSDTGLTVSGAYRMFSVANPLTNISAINNFTSSINYGNNNPSYLKHYFRWSTDNEYWSQWYEFDRNLGILPMLSFASDKPFYFGYKIAYDNGTSDPLPTPIKITDFGARFETTIQKPSLRAEATVSNELILNSFVNRTAAPIGLYNNPALVQLNQSLSYAMMTMFGIDMLYFRTAPDKTGTDFVFREHTLYNIVERKCIKMIANNNEFPDDDFEFNGDGIHYTQPFELHIDKQFFEDNFGIGFEPRKKDIVYIPLINRMFQVDQTSLKRGYLKCPLFWKLRMSKFNNNINLGKDEDTAAFLDNMLISSNDAFGDKVESQVLNATLPQQSTPPTTKSDEVRKYLDNSLMVHETQVDFNFSRLINYYYDMSTPTDDYGVVYNKNISLSSSKDVAICFMFRIKNGATNFSTIQSSDGTSFSIDFNYSATTKDMTASVLGLNLLSNQIEIDKWYSVFINLSGIFKQANITLYDLVDTANKNKHFKLSQLSTIAMNVANFNDIDTSIGIKKGLYDIANIRVFNKCMPAEKQKNIISELMLRDEALLTIIDNSRPRMNVPLIMKKY